MAALPIVLRGLLKAIPADDLRPRLQQHFQNAASAMLQQSLGRIGRVREVGFAIWLLI